MRLSRRRLNRTLLRRQHLLDRVDLDPHAMAAHLVGLQAQETLPPYLSLQARLSTFDPYTVTRALEERTLVRLLSMGSTIHLLTPDGELADEDEPAPPRLLGTYDNVWLSHAARDRVTDPAKRQHWMGSNGGVAMTVFVDGMLEGLWRPVDGRVEVGSTFRALTRRERSALDDEITRIDELLAR